MQVREIQKQLNYKVGSTLNCDNIKGPYTNSCIRMAKRAMNLPYNNIITDVFLAKLKEDKIWLLESFERINRIDDLIWLERETIYNWIKRKKHNTILKFKDIDEIDRICMFMGFSTLHCLAHLIIESAWGTSYKIRKNRNGFGIGVTDSRERRYKLKYLKVGTSAYEWASLLNRLYIPRKQISEQKLNLDYGRYGKHPEYFDLKEIPKNWRAYASSQSKSVSVGLLVKEMKNLLNE